MKGFASLRYISTINKESWKQRALERQASCQAQRPFKFRDPASDEHAMVEIRIDQVMEIAACSGEAADVGRMA